jgi:hypothetical protein
MNDRHLHILGQIGGYGAGLAAWLNLAKDFVGLVGIIAGATLSIWALIDRINKFNRRK